MAISDASIQLAIANITDFGDTDIFPYPIENRIFFDKQQNVVDLLKHIDRSFKDFLSDNPPENVSELSPNLGDGRDQAAVA